MPSADRRPPDRRTADTVRGILLKLASTVVFAAMVAAVKLVADRIPLGEIVFFRAVFSLPPLLVWLHRNGGLQGRFRTSDPFGHFLRAAFGSAGMAFWFAAIARLPLPDVQAISFAGPLLGVVLAVVWLGEVVRLYRWAAVLVGFLGVLIVLSEHIGSGAVVSDRGAVGALCALAFALSAALAMVQVRRLTATEDAGTIVFYFCVFGALFALATAPFGWVVPDAWDFAVLVFIGLSGGCSQILLTNAFRCAEASLIAPFEYASMLWVVLIALFVFGEVPSVPVIVGSLIVIGAGVFVALRERRLGIQRARERQAGPPA